MEEFKEKKKELKEDTDNTEKNNSEITSEAEEQTFKEVDVSTLPAGIEDFLGFMPSVYDYESMDSDSVIEHLGLLLAGNASSPDYVHIHYLISDPDGFAYEADANEVDWYFHNILNVDGSILDEIKSKSSYRLAYVDNKYKGEHQTHPHGVIYPIGYTVNFALFDGEKYYIEYCVDYGEDYSPFIGYALVEYKMIDGSNYWSVYKSDRNPFLEEE